MGPLRSNTPKCRRLAPLLLKRVPQLTEHYTRYAKQWAAGAEHALRSLEANARCADLISAYGEGGGGGSLRTTSSRPSAVSDVTDISDHAAAASSSRRASSALSDAPDPFPTAPIGFGGSRLRCVTAGRERTYSLRGPLLTLGDRLPYMAGTYLRSRWSVLLCTSAWLPSSNSRPNQLSQDGRRCALWSSSWLH